jgi:integrase
LNEITPWHIEKYKLKRKIEVSEASVNRELSCLKHLFSLAIKWNKASRNPVKEVKLFREKNQRLRYLSIDEDKRLLDECNGYLRPIVITALHTGMRKSEILNLRWSQVDFERGCVIVVNTKNDEVRDIPMNATLTDCLTNVKVLSKGEYVFSRQEGKPPKSIRTAFENAVKRAELGDFHFHDIRHAFASKLVMSGVDLLTVKELLGHKTIAMTMRYSHLSQEYKRKAIRFLDGHNMGTNIDFGKVRTS